MSCHRYQSQLSLNLDGRLSSARRESLMQHVDSCDVCSRFWNELQAAQRLAMRLPQQQVSADFRSSLFERIHAGEGTPEAVFREPIPTTTKVRYLLSGAAAAAALLLVFDLWRGPIDNQDFNVGGGTEQVADNGGPGTFLRPLSPASLAEISAQTVAHGVNDLRQRQRSLSNRLASEPLPQLRQQMEPKLRALRGSAHAMRWMSEKRIIGMPADLRAAFDTVEEVVSSVQGAKNRQELQAALERLTRIQPDQFVGEVDVLCCDQEQMFTELFSGYAQRQNPEIGLVVKVLKTDNQLLPGQPSNGSTYMFLQRQTTGSQTFQLQIRMRHSEPGDQADNAIPRRLQRRN